MKHALLRQFYPPSVVKKKKKKSSIFRTFYPLLTSELLSYLSSYFLLFFLHILLNSLFTYITLLSKLNIFFVARAYTPFNSNRASHLFYDTLRFTCMFSCPLWCVAIFIYFSTSDVWTREKKISWALIFFLTCCTSFDEFCARFVLEFVWNFKFIGF